jgi:hypothetical protein
VRRFSTTQESFPGSHDERFIARVREHLGGIRHIHYPSPFLCCLRPHRNMAGAVGWGKERGKIDATGRML